MRKAVARARQGDKFDFKAIYQVNQAVDVKVILADDPFKKKSPVDGLIYLEFAPGRR